MPIYEYLCSQCNHHCEIIQKFSDEPETHCPACQQESLKRQISAASFHLKGSGWYVTDFRDKDKPKTAAANEKNNSEQQTATSPDNKQDNKNDKTTKESAKASSETKTSSQSPAKAEIE